MGQCCSAPPRADEAVDIRASRALDAAAGHLHAGPPGLGGAWSPSLSPTGGLPRHAHHHAYGRSASSRSAGSRSAHKHLLRAATLPPLLPPHQQLSPRTWQHLQHLLPAAPLQELAAGQQLRHAHHDHHHPRQHGGFLEGGDGGSDAMHEQRLHAAAAFATSGSAALGADPSPHGHQRQHGSGHFAAGFGGAVHPQGGSHALHLPGPGAGAVHLHRSASAAAAAAAAAARAPALSPEQVLSLCGSVVQENALFEQRGITPLLLASICLIESGGCPDAATYREHLGDTAYGLCQMLLSTAQWLATTQGFARHGAAPTAASLADPKACVYFCGAYLAAISLHHGAPRSEGFVVRAYNAGPKAVHSAPAVLYLQKYLKAKHCLLQVARAAAVTVAAAALPAGVTLPGPPGAAGPAAGGAAAPPQRAKPDALKAAVLAATGGRGASAATPAAPSGDQGGRDQEDRDQDSSSGGGGGEEDDAAVLVRSQAASIIAVLASSWDAPAQQAPGGDDAAAAGAAGSGAGGFLASMLPSLWHLSSHRQQQNEARRSRAGSGPDGVSSGGSSSSGGGGGGGGRCAALVPVSRSALLTAWQRVVAISPFAASTALEQAAAAAALAPAAGPPRAPAAAAAAGPAGRSCSSSSAADAADASAAMPCVMHVVGHGETLGSIAAACGLAVPALLAANPELPDADAAQHNDCIALPLAAVFPRLHVVRPGDSLPAIARAHGVPVGRLLAKNPELLDPAKLQPGWVVALPGLKGDSKGGLPADWLLHAALAADAAPPPAPASAARRGDGVRCDDELAPPAAWQPGRQWAWQGQALAAALPWGPTHEELEQEQDHQVQQQQQQHELAAAMSWPGTSVLLQQQQQQRRLRHNRRSDSAAIVPWQRSAQGGTGGDGGGGSEPLTPIAAGFIDRRHSTSSSSSQDGRRHSMGSTGSALHLPPLGSGTFMFAVGDAR